MPTMGVRALLVGVMGKTGCTAARTVFAAPLIGERASCVAGLRVVAAGARYVGVERREFAGGEQNAQDA